MQLLITVTFPFDALHIITQLFLQLFNLTMRNFSMQIIIMQNKKEKKNNL